MKIMVFICLSAILFLNLKCKSTLDDLPPETQNGSDTFGCLVNGKIWQPYGRIGLTSNITPEYGADGYFKLSGYYAKNGKTSGLGFSAYGIYKEGKYKIVGLNEIGNPQQGSTGYTDENSCQYGIYQTNILSGEVEITKFQRQTDRSLIVAGRFNYTLTSPYTQCKDTIRITQGRFDIKFD